MEETGGSIEEKTTQIEVQFDIIPGERVSVRADGKNAPEITRQTAEVKGVSRRKKPSKPASSISVSRLANAAARLLGQERWLAVMTLVVVLAAGWIGLGRFPASFTSGEADSSVAAVDLLRRGLQTEEEFLPAFFKSVTGEWLGLSVYLQLLGYLLAGQSVWMVRAVSALAGLTGLAWLGLTLKRFFLPDGSSGWLAGILLGCLAPAWFLFARTGHPAVLTAAFYAGLWYFYLLYREGKPRALYAALCLGGLAFYASSAGRVIVPLTLLSLAVIDWRRHRQQRWLGIGVLGLVVLFGIPLARWLVNHPGSAGQVMLGDSFWLQDNTLGEKLRLAGGNALAALNPAYWFFLNPPDAAIFKLVGRAHLPLLLLPLAGLGAWQALRPAARSSQRLILVWLLVIPAAAALLGNSIQHSLPLSLALILLAAVGLENGLGWLTQRWPNQVHTLRAGTLLGLAVWAAGFTASTLGRSPVTASDTSISGLQYGAQQVFALTRDYQRSHPQARIWISPSWIEHPEVLLRFFASQTELESYQINGMDSFLKEVRGDIGELLFVQSAGEFAAAAESRLFEPAEVVGVVNYPDGQPGIFLARYQYAANAAAVLQEEKDQIHRLTSTTYFLNGQNVEVRHSALDMGGVENLFDGDPNTLIRSQFANPLVIELRLPEARVYSGVSVRVGAEPVRLTVVVTDDAGQVQTFQQEESWVKDYKEISLRFPAPLQVKQMRLEILDSEVGEPSNVHVWEVELVE